MKGQKLNKHQTGLTSFIILWISQSISELGSAMTSYALVLWAYQQKGTAMSTASMAFFSYLPYVLISFAAGTLADRWKKKNIMLVCDTIAAAGSGTIFLLLCTNSLQLWHLYLINLLIGCMNAFQQPASMVAVTLLTPKKYYSNVSGMQAMSASCVSILQPALATALMAFGGIQTVLAADLISFAVAFLTLAFLIHIPEIPTEIPEAPTEIPEASTVKKAKKEGFWQDSMEGIRYLRKRRGIWKMILFFALVNLLASMGGNALMPALILSRTANNTKILGAVSACLGFGTLCGGLLATLAKLPGSRRKTIFWSCGISFLACDVLWSVGRNQTMWSLAAFLGNFPLPLLNAGMSSVMREQIPVEMQGRIFSTQATFQFFTIPAGYLLGGILADYIFEPWMAYSSPTQSRISLLVGSGKGSGIALIFLLTGLTGFCINMAALKDRDYLELDRRPEES